MILRPLSLTPLTHSLDRTARVLRLLSRSTRRCRRGAMFHQPTVMADWQHTPHQHEAHPAQLHTQMDNGQQMAQWTAAEANQEQISQQQPQEWAHFHQEQEQRQLQWYQWQSQQQSLQQHQQQPSSAEFQQQSYASPTQQPDQSAQFLSFAHPSSSSLQQQHDAWQPVAPQPQLEQQQGHEWLSAHPDSSFHSAEHSTPSRQPHSEASTHEAQRADANANATAPAILPQHRRMASPATSLLCSKLERALTDRPTIAALMQKNVLHSNPSDAAAVSRSIDRLARALHTEKEQRAEVRQRLKSKLRARPSLDLLIRQHIWPQFQDDPQQTLDLTPVSSATHVRHRSMATDAHVDPSGSGLTFAQQLDDVGVLPVIAEQSSVSPFSAQLHSPHTIAAGSSASSHADAAAATGAAAASSSTAATDPAQLSQAHLNAVRASFLDQLLTRFATQQERDTALQQQSHALAGPGAADTAQMQDLQALLQQVRHMNRGE